MGYESGDIYTCPSRVNQSASSVELTQSGLYFFKATRSPQMDADWSISRGTSIDISRFIPHGLLRFLL